MNAVVLGLTVWLTMVIVALGSISTTIYVERLRPGTSDVFWRGLGKRLGLYRVAHLFVMALHCVCRVWRELCRRLDVINWPRPFDRFIINTIERGLGR